MPRGGTQGEAADNIREAIAAHIESRLKHGEPVPHETGTQRIVLAVCVGLLLQILRDSDIDPDELRR